MALQDAEQRAVFEIDKEFTVRTTFAEELVNLAEQDDRVYLLIGDLGVFPEFQRRFPKRFINLGIAESNQISVAAGLAQDGNKVFLYSVAGFCIHRGFEQLKFEVCHWNKNIVLVNASAGLCYNRVGAGHYLIDDLALMQALPDVTICTPIDRPEFKKALYESYEANNMYYIRTALDNCPDIERRDDYLQFDDSNKVTVVSTGVFSPVAQRVCKGLPVDVLHIPYIQKIDPRYLKEKVFVIEDHIKFGGLASLLDKKPDLHICLPDLVNKTAHSRNELLKMYGFDDESLRSKIEEALCLTEI